MATADQLTTMLKEAEAAYHDLCVGMSIRTIVHQNGQRSEYTPATRFLLKSYIEELKAQLATLGVTGYTNTGPRPMRVWF